MSSLALLMQQQQVQESTCEKDSLDTGNATSWHADRFESTTKKTSCHHRHQHKAPPRQYSSSSTDVGDSPELEGHGDVVEMDETQPAPCSSSYSDHYLVAMHPCSPKSAPTWNWMHRRQRGVGAAAASKLRPPRPFGGITKNSHIAASIEALNRQYHQQIYLGTDVGTNGDEGDDLVSCNHHLEEEKTSPEFNNTRLPEAETPEETIFELEM